MITNPSHSPVLYSRMGSIIYVFLGRGLTACSSLSYLWLSSAYEVGRLARVGEDQHY